MASVALSSATHLNTAYLVSLKISHGILMSDHNVADLNPQKDVMSGGTISCDSKKKVIVLIKRQERSSIQTSARKIMSSKPRTKAGPEGAMVGII